MPSIYAFGDEVGRFCLYLVYYRRTRG